MKKIISMLIAFSVFLLLLTTRNEKNTIIVYSSMEQFRNDALQEQLLNRFPNQNVRVMYIPTAKSAAKIFLEKEKTDADIVVGLETSYLFKIKDELEDISNISTIDYLDEFNSEIYDNKFLIWERQAGSFVINEKLLKERKLPIPNSYEDLLNPMYKNLIAMPDPKSSGTGFFFYQNLVNSMGEQEALNYIDNLALNIKQFTESGSGPMKLLNQEEIAIGLALTFQGANEVNKGRDYKILFPEEGSPYSLTGTGMIKGRRENKDIEEVFEFIVNDFIEYDKMYFSPETIFYNQINKVNNYPQNINYADMTGIESIVEKERLLSFWKY